MGYGHTSFLCFDVLGVALNIHSDTYHNYGVTLDMKLFLERPEVALKPRPARYPGKEWNLQVNDLAAPDGQAENTIGTACCVIASLANSPPSFKIEAALRTHLFARLLDAAQAGRPPKTIELVVAGADTQDDKLHWDLQSVEKLKIVDIRFGIPLYLRSSTTP